MKNKSEENQVQKDSVKTVSVVKMTKITSSTKINSKEGAIIPREVLYMTKIQNTAEPMDTNKSVKMTKLELSTKTNKDDKTLSSKDDLLKEKFKKDFADSVKVVKMEKLVPATKINSNDGAIVPKEVLSMTKIQPAIVFNKNENDEVLPYFLIGIGVVVAILIIRKIFFARSKK